MLSNILAGIAYKVIYALADLIVGAIIRWSDDKRFKKKVEKEINEANDTNDTSDLEHTIGGL